MSYIGYPKLDENLALKMLQTYHLQDESKTYKTLKDFAGGEDNRQPALAFKYEFSQVNTDIYTYTVYEFKVDFETKLGVDELFVPQNKGHTKNSGFMDYSVLEFKYIIVPLVENHRVNEGEDYCILLAIDTIITDISGNFVERITNDRIYRLDFSKKDDDTNVFSLHTGRDFNQKLHNENDGSSHIHIISDLRMDLFYDRISTSTVLQYAFGALNYTLQTYRYPARMQLWFEGETFAYRSSDHIYRHSYGRVSAPTLGEKKLILDKNTDVYNTKPSIFNV
jgi:hypothetical protein